MENLSRPEFRAVRCDRALLAELCAQLARPASFRCGGSDFSLRN
jgi:hypothetical protein